MTKPRAPLTTDAALARIAGHVEGGWGALARRLELSESYLRACGDPDRREKIAFDDAIALDLLYRAEGGEGAPLFETYARQLDVDGAFRFADEIALGRHAMDVMREGNEAHIALVAAALPGASPAQRRQALREVEEAIEVLDRARPLLAGLEAFDQFLAGHAPTGPPGEG